MNRYSFREGENLTPVMVNTIQFCGFLAKAAANVAIALSDCSDEYKEQALDEMNKANAETLASIDDKFYEPYLMEHYQNTFDIYAPKWCKGRKVV